MRVDSGWADRLKLDIDFGYLQQHVVAPKEFHPQVILNGESASVLRVIRSELRRCESFAFSVAFVSPRAIALLKQELVDFEGAGMIVTSDYLGFNSPQAFAELLNLANLDIDIRIHNASAFHPKGYLFQSSHTVTALVGSSNLTETALVSNYEWNLKVSAAAGSDLAAQFDSIVEQSLQDSTPLTRDWIEQYSAAYIPPPQRQNRPRDPSGADEDTLAEVTPNRMQLNALEAIAQVRGSGERRAIVISATGTGKTMLSALDVRSFSPRRMLFIVHREQILDRTIHEYRRVLGGELADYGKLTGNSKEFLARYTFATIQTLSQRDVLDRFAADHFDYVIVDEAHRSGAPTYQRVLEHFDPSFLLGMTATPERTDGANVFELFDYNVPYEIRLNHALEEDMLSPFHYYGVADLTFDDGTTADSTTNLQQLISPERVDHLIKALETYGQAGVAPRGIIFCGRTQEASTLSQALNARTLRGRTFRTISLTGADTIAEREAQVAALERGELDYILTVDVFNEGVDIPSLNQVVMLRQTQSAIVFVQQLGRGLRKFKDKEYLVVIDFIGNYANNYLIPIALFGDESLNRESLRKNLITAEETGVLPGLSSVRFDRISQQRVLDSIKTTKLDSMQNLKAALVAMRNRVGGAPKLWDFYRFESVDPVLLATKKEHYPALVQSLLRIDHGLSDPESRMLWLISAEICSAKRPHEFILLRELLTNRELSREHVSDLFVGAGLPSTDRLVDSTIDSFTLNHHTKQDRDRYKVEIMKRNANGGAFVTDDFRTAYSDSPNFRNAVDDIIRTCTALVRDRYTTEAPFTVGRQYSRRESLRLLGLPQSWTSTLYGYKADRASGLCPIYITLHKSDDVAASTAYEDALIDPSTMVWSSKSNRTLDSEDVRAILEDRVDLHVFVKKDDAEGADHYYLGKAASSHPRQITMTNDNGAQLPAVKMVLRFEQPIDSALFDYFHPSVT